jgi:hypothetical protein
MDWVVLEKPKQPSSSLLNHPGQWITNSLMSALRDEIFF